MGLRATHNPPPIVGAIIFARHRPMANTEYPDGTRNSGISRVVWMSPCCCLGSHRALTSITTTFFTVHISCLSSDCLGFTRGDSARASQIDIASGGLPLDAALAKGIFNRLVSSALRVSISILWQRNTAAVSSESRFLDIGSMVRCGAIQYVL